MRKPKISEKQFVLDCINKEFSIADTGLHFDTFEDLTDWSKDNKEWFLNYTFPSFEKYEEWEDYFMTHFYDWKSKSYSKREVRREFAWFDLNYGFAVQDNVH